MLQRASLFLVNSINAFPDIHYIILILFLIIFLVFDQFQVNFVVSVYTFQGLSY